MKQDNSINVTERINSIENAVYAAIRQYGFRKYGRTLHRRVSDDISQSITFFCGQSYLNATHLMWVETGIRVPECVERTFGQIELKKYYSTVPCNIRSSLGEIDGKKTIEIFDLRKDITSYSEKIIDKLVKKVIPVFDILSSRESILLHRKEYPTFDVFNNHLMVLEEAMIYGHLGDMDKAKESFNKYYELARIQCKNPSHFRYLDELAVKLGFAE